MGATTPDGLPWPELAEPGNVPQDMQELAGATQTALLGRMPVAYETGAATYEPAWYANTDPYGGVSVFRMGKLVVARGLARRNANLTVTDNTTITFASLPAGFWPERTFRAAGAWVCLTGGVSNLMTTQILINAAGGVSVISNVDGTFRANSDWVSLSGISWVTL